MTDYYFPLKNLTDTNNITGVANFVNEVTGGIFWLLIFLTAWVIMFMVFIRFGEKQALTVSSFGASLISYLLAGIGLINPGFVLIPTALTVFGVLIMNGGNR